MPAVASSPSVDTALPGLTRRRVWHAPAVASHSLLALTYTKLYLAPAGPAPKPDAVSNILDGADLDDAFGPFATVIDMAAVSRVKLDLVTNELALEYRRPAGQGSGVVGRTPRGEVVIAFADHATADDVYTKVWRRLGDRVALKPHRRNPGEASRSPVAAMVAALVATFVLALGASAAADATDPHPVLAWLKPFDWRVIAGFGGAALAALQVWLYRRVTHPPAKLELIARS